jgi:phosphatidylglycerol:prolipoprotein diacylglycerol transferase
MTASQVDDFLVWAAIGVVLGGRLGYALFYRPDFYLAHPLEALKLWQGGMSFHGGLIGVMVAMILFARRRGVALLGLSDMVSGAVPIGLFFGRLANFINAELVGRPSDVPWAMIFPGAGSRPRHPSQLYEAALEGVVLFGLLWWLARAAGGRRPGLVTGAFLVGYALARFLVEFFRQPDAHLGLLALDATMGQWLSLPALLFGLVLIVRARGS